MVAVNDARLIGLDWGSSSLRAFLIGPGGEVLDQRSNDQGSAAMDAQGARYAATLAAIAGDWMAMSLPLIACGMVGSQHGWAQAPYLDCPTELGALAHAGARVTLDGGATLTIVPGLRCRPSGQPYDVMRGEETQIAGVLAAEAALAERSTVVLPGTHSKWARVEQGRVIDFATHMTGELFAVLRAHSVLGRLMPAAATPGDVAAFALGVAAARDGAALGLAHQLFAVRTLGLMDELAGAALPDYLSGLLIGAEVQAGLAARAAAGQADAPLALAGEPVLCARYAHALSLLDAPAPSLFPNTAPTGLWRIALAGGLVKPDAHTDFPS
jgi:2-dehydro-3-deoxygalactonokinase